MYPQQIQQYLLKFFNETNCPIITCDNHYISVQLSIEMDKKIMNRPFYWHYLASTGDDPKPAQLTLITDKNQYTENIKGEIVHFGSPRLTQLFQVTKEKGSFVQLYERVNEAATKQTVLTPWLGVNYKITYSCDQTKEMLYSLGINLLTGYVVENFQDTLNKIELDTKISSYTFHIPYIIKPIRALDRLDAVIDNKIQQDDHYWAEEAKKRWQKDQRVLEYFYEGVEDRPKSYEIEKEAMEQQYASKISIDIINGGVFYLK